MRKVRVISAVLVVAAVAFVGPARGQAKTEPALDKVREAFVAAFNARDASRVAALFTDDGVLMPPEEPTVTGRDDIDASFERNFAGHLVHLQMEPMESAVSGGRGFEIGISTVKVTVEGRRPETVTARYVAVLERVGSEWKFAYQMFNTDRPAPRRRR